MVALAVPALTGCGPAIVQVHSAPSLPAQVVAQRMEYQSRTLDLDAGTVFPKVLDVLMDQGFLVQCADGGLGMVSFRQKWEDPDQGASLFLEGCLRVTSLEPGKTRIRLLLTGRSLTHGMSWSAPVPPTPGQASPLRPGSTPVPGPVNPAPQARPILSSSVQQNLDPEAYTRILDLLEKGLLSK